MMTIAPFSGIDNLHHNRRRTERLTVFRLFFASEGLGGAGKKLQGKRLVTIARTQRARMSKIVNLKHVVKS